MSTPPPPDVLMLVGQWFERPTGGAIRSLQSAGAFSGAKLWRVTHDAADYVLRQWPPSAGSARRIELLTQFQSHLAAAGLPVPAPVPLRDGGWVYARFDAHGAVSSWSMTSWLPGEANFWHDRRAAKLAAACEMLAHLHAAAAAFTPSDGESQPGVSVSPSMLRRIARLEALRAELCELHKIHFANVPAIDRNLAVAIVAHLETVTPGVREQLARWATQPLPLQWRLGDIWHDHVLFTGDKVTGIIDFGAAGIDSSAGDIARLLGSLVGDDRERWQAGLAAYETERTLSPLEREAAAVFDASGTIAAAANWLAWLWPRSPADAPPISNRPAALDRLRKLKERLAVLASA
jgi:Ser/Thr protein kinase RdoA (MazF antagonist)